MSEADALTHFQDRENAIAAFDALWNQGERQWVLAFDGFSGHGKSTLIQWLELQRCEANNIPYSLTDFAVLRGYKDLLGGIIRHSGLRSHISQAAYSDYESKRDKILEDRDRQVNSIVIEQHQIDGSGNQQEVNINLAEAKHMIDLQSRERLTDAWLDCVNKLQHNQIVIFLDTYENYQNSVSKSDIDWLWTTLEEAHKLLPSLRIIIGSRQKFNSVKHYVQQIQLDAFTPEYSDTLLISLGILDDDYRKAVYENLAKGHPLVTRFAADAWLKAQSIGKPIIANQVPRAGKLEDAVRWIEDIVLANLPESFQSAVRWAALLRSFNLEILNEILDVRLNENQFRELTAYSFIEINNDMFGWKCHDLVRDVQSEYLAIEQPQAFIDFHKKAAYYFKLKGYTLEYLYHHFTYDKDRAFEEWLSEIHTEQAKFNFERCEHIFEIFEGRDIKLDDLERAVYLRTRGLHYSYLSDFQKAEIFLIESKSIYDDRNHFLGSAMLSEALGDIEKARNNRVLARKYYQNAFELYSSIGNDNTLGRVHHELGILDVLEGNIRQAGINYNAAIRLIDSTSRPNDYANLLTSIANFNLMLGNFDEAYSEYEQAHKLYVSVKNRRGEASALYQLGEIKSKRGDLNSAKKLVYDAIRIFQETASVKDEADAYITLGDIHSNDYSGGIENLNEHLIAAEKCYSNALDLFQKIDNKRGEAFAYFSIGTLLIRNGQFQEAKKYLELSLSYQDTDLPPFDIINIFIGLVQVEFYLRNIEQSKAHYENAINMADKNGIQYTPAILGLRHNFWSMIFTIEEDLYILSMRVLDWMLKPSKDASKEYLYETHETLLSPDAIKVISLMLDFGPDEKLLVSIP